MKKLALLLTCVILFQACKKSDNKNTAYNGFKVSGTLYSSDSIEHDYPNSLRPLSIHSKDNGGGHVYFHLGWNFWPPGDGVYKFTVKAVIQDSADATLCFEPEDGSFETYCAVSGASGQSLSTLTITISGGKWSVSLPATTIYDNSAKSLEIQAND